MQRLLLPQAPWRGRPPGKENLFKIPTQKILGFFFFFPWLPNSRWVAHGWGRQAPEWRRFKVCHRHPCKTKISVSGLSFNTMKHEVAVMTCFACHKKLLVAVYRGLLANGAVVGHCVVCTMLALAAARPQRPVPRTRPSGTKIRCIQVWGQRGLIAGTELVHQLYKGAIWKCGCPGISLCALSESGHALVSVPCLCFCVCALGAL